MKKTIKQPIEEGIAIGRKDVILRKELADIERDLINEIKSNDCFVQYDLCGLFTLTGFIERKVKEAKLSTLQKVCEEIKKWKKTLTKSEGYEKDGSIVKLYDASEEDFKELLKKFKGEEK